MKELLRILEIWARARVYASGYKIICLWRASKQFIIKNLIKKSSPDCYKLLLNIKKQLALENKK